MALRARYRLRLGLTPFQVGIEPSLDEAQIDRLDIEFNSGAIAFAPATGRRGFLELLRLSGPFRTPRYAPGRITLTTSDAALPSITLRTGPPRTFSIPRGDGRGQVDVERSNLRVDVVTSLSRQLAHHPNCGDEDVADVVRCLERDTAAEERLSRLSLDRNDNFLPLAQWQSNRPFFPRAIRALRQLLDEYAGVLNLVGGDAQDLPDRILRLPFDRRVEAAAEFGDFNTLVELPWSHWIMRRCEIFWEFRTADAVSLVHHLRPFLFSVSKDATAADYDVPPPRPYREPGRGRWRQIRNAISVVTTTSNRHIEIAAYAKEYDRIRFEVRYLKNVRQIFGSRASEAQFNPTFDGLAALLNFLRQDARGRLFRLFTALPELHDTDNPLHVYSEFVAAVARAGGPHVYAIERVLRLLLANAAISPTGSEAEDGIIARLARDGVLEQARPNQREGEPRYHLAPRFSAVIIRALATMDRNAFR